MNSGFIRNFCAFVLLALGATLASAATFNFTVVCPADTVVGPVTVLANTNSGSVTLTQGVSSVQFLLPTNNITRVDNNAAPGGTYVGVLACTLTLGGVAAPFTRSFSLNVPPLPAPPATGTMTTGAVSFTVDLGVQGKVDISAPAGSTLGFDRALSNGGFIIVPGILDSTLLLHDVPTVAIPALGEWGLAVMAALLALLAMVAMRRTR